MTKRPEMLLWLSDARGVYIPRDFANSFADRAKHVANVSAEDWSILELGPDSTDDAGNFVSNESYWDTWTDVCDNAVVTDEHGAEYTIWQEGDCWLVPKGMEWNDKTDSFDWPDERETEDAED